MPEYVTAAPEAYDGFGTITVAWFNRRPLDRHSLRRVRILQEHLGWQMCRYSSGLFACVPAKRWAFWEPSDCSAAGSTPVRVLEAEEVYSLPEDSGQPHPYDLEPGHFTRVRRVPNREIIDGGYLLCNIYEAGES